MQRLWYRTEPRRMGVNKSDHQDAAVYYGGSEDVVSHNRYLDWAGAQSTNHTGRKAPYSSGWDEETPHRKGKQPRGRPSGIKNMGLGTPMTLEEWHEANPDWPTRPQVDDLVQAIALYKGNEEHEEHGEPNGFDELRTELVRQSERDSEASRRRRRTSRRPLNVYVQ